MPLDLITLTVDELTVLTTAELTTMLPAIRQTTYMTLMGTPGRRYGSFAAKLPNWTRYPYPLHELVGGIRE